jgi:hypothetical protein
VVNGQDMYVLDYILIYVMIHAQRFVRLLSCSSMINAAYTSMKQISPSGANISMVICTERHRSCTLYLVPCTNLGP